jgi:lipid-A-disaccharide synthase
VTTASPRPAFESAPDLPLARPPRVLVSCGEASGDLYAAALVRQLKLVAPGLDAFGFGGEALRAEGVDLVSDYRDVNVTGLVEAVRVLPRSLQILGKLETMARERRPDVFVAIDFPDFNFRLLPVMRRLGVPVVYYVSPQLWAWRPGRVRQIQKYVRKMLVIFPFEVEVYEKAGVPVEFVGHPLVDLLATPVERTSWLSSVGLVADRPIVALLPGSRPNEVARILPVLLETVPLIARRVPGVQFLVARAPSLPDDLFARATTTEATVRVALGVADAVLASADVVVTASGTATVQTALHGKPMVMVYKLASLTYRIGRAFVRVPHYGMVNLIAGRRIVPELIQDACTPAAVAEETVRLLTDAVSAERMRTDLADVRNRLGGGGASLRAARAVLGAMGR